MATKNESRSRNKKSDSAAAGKSSEGAAGKAPHEVKDGVRETVESIVIAFVLAFLFRTFEAEAFVIPTGSMAPTLMGQHKDLKCNKCGFPYQVGASQEVPPENMTSARDREDHIHGNRVVAFTCPNCRYEMRFGKGEPDGLEPPPSYKGDRIIVGKSAYEVGKPRRWDVAVFKYPEQAKINFIKRLVGLPEETVVIHYGDIFTTDAELPYGPIAAEDAAQMKRQGTLSIARKPPAKVQAMLQAVYDNDYQLPEPFASSFPPRWSRASDSRPEAWREEDDGKTFRYDGQSDQDEWIGYQHLVPSEEDWQAAAKDQEPGKTLRIEPRLISDFYAYNTGRPARSINVDPPEGNWVGDLSLSCQVKTESGEGEVLLALVEGGVIFQCRIDLASGQAAFSISADPSFKAAVETPVRGAGTHQLEFANVDDKLYLWVDGKSMEFDGRYGPLDNLIPNEDDQAPARLGSHGAELAFSHLRLRRDVYYTDPRRHARDGFGGPPGGNRWEQDAAAYWLGPGEFLMLGDNSPQSKDSRLWNDSEYFVSRELLIGKALFIYWPHGLDHLPGTDVWFPLFPNFGRMGFVR